MSFATVVKGEDRETEMAIQNGRDERKTSNSGLCMSAGIKTPIDDDDDDQKRFQRRHFPYKMSSDIFFCDSSSEDIAPSEDIVSSENNVNRENVHPSAGMETRNVDEKQSERRHFEQPPEDCMQLENTASGDEQVDSAGASESTDEIETDDADLKPTQRRHFHDKTSSNIFFCGLPEEDVESRNPSDFRKRKG